MGSMYSSASHYIILEDSEDGFDLSETCGPLGFVCAHGGIMMYERLASRIQMGKPLVMLYNTGGLVQCFGSLVRAISRNPKLGAEELLKCVEVCISDPHPQDYYTRTPPRDMTRTHRPHVCPTCGHAHRSPTSPYACVP